MNMNEFFSDLKNHKKVPSLKVSKAATIKELYDNVIEPTLPSKETVIGWDKMLNEYLKHNDKILLVRRYASDKDKNGKWDTRRGLLTEYPDGFRYAYVDNFFPQLIYYMAYNDFVPEEEDFRAFITNFKMPYGFRETEEEAPYQAFKKCQSIGVNEANYKLSHMFSANQHKDYDRKKINYLVEKKILFPKGCYKDWETTKVCEETNYTYHVRMMKDNLNKEQKEKIEAHFMRVVHPLNYFLTPKKDFHTSDVFNKDIGELEEVIQYVYLQLEKIYKDIVPSFKDTVMGVMNITKSEEELANVVIDLSYGEKVTKSNSTSGLTSIEKANVLYEYLFNGLSHKKVEQKVFGEAIKGWKSWAVTKEEFDLEKEYKGKLKGQDLESLEAEDITYEKLKKAVIYIQENIE